MEFNPSYSQLLYLFALAFSGETPNARRPGLDGARRRPLEETGFIQRNGEVMELTEQGFRWVENHLEMIPEDARRAGLTERAPLLMASAIGSYLKAQGLRLRDLLVPTAAQPQSTNGEPVTPDVEPGVAVVDTPEAPDSLSNAIREAYLKITAGATGTRVHLSEIRSELGHWDREEVDTALLTMYRDGRVRFDRLDEATEETPRDQEAALLVHDNPRHYVTLVE